MCVYGMSYTLARKSFETPVKIFTPKCKIINNKNIKYISRSFVTIESAGKLSKTSKINFYKTITTGFATKLVLNLGLT